MSFETFVYLCLAALGIGVCYRSIRAAHTNEDETNNLNIGDPTSAKKPFVFSKNARTEGTPQFEQADFPTFIFDNGPDIIETGHHDCGHVDVGHDFSCDAGGHF